MSDGPITNSPPQTLDEMRQAVEEVREERRPHIAAHRQRPAMSADEVRKGSEARNAEMLLRAAPKRKTTTNMTPEEIRARVKARRQEAREQHGDNQVGSPERPVIDPDFIWRCCQNEEEGDGELFAALHKDTFFFNATTREWFFFNGAYSEIDVHGRALCGVRDVADLYAAEAVRVQHEINTATDKDRIKLLEFKRKTLSARARKLKTDRGRKACLAFAAAGKNTGMSVTSDQLDADPWFFAYANGVMDLRTGELRPGKLKDYITKASPYPWHGLDASRARFEAALLDICAGRQAIVDFLQRWFGYCLTGLTNEQKLPILVGRGRNGKGLVRNCLTRAVGPSWIQFPAEVLLDQGGSKSSSAPTPDLMSFKGARAAFGSELDEGRKGSASRIKLLTGGDPICARAGYDRYFTTFMPTHKLILLTNERPKIPPDDYAIWERIIEVPFDLSYVDREPQNSFERRRDPKLEEKIMATEGPGILAWLVMGCLLWQRDGLAPPPEILCATAEYRRNEDLLLDWIEARCSTDDPSSETRSTELYESYTAWHEENIGKKVPFQHRFGRDLQKKFKRLRKRSGYVYVGLRLL